MTDFGAAAGIVLFPLAFLLVHVFYAPEQTLLQPDSDGYLAFGALRTGGYPFLIALMKPFAGGPRAIVNAQVALCALSTALVGWQLYRVSGNLIGAIVPQVMLLANPTVDKFHFTIMTESVFLSVSTLFVAAALAYLRTASTLALASAALAAGAAAAIRPTGFVFVPAVLLLAFLVPRDNRLLLRQVAVTAAALVAVFVLESVYYHAHHPGPRQTQASIHIFAKGGLTDVPDPDALLRAAPPEARALQRALQDELAPVRRLIAAAPNAQAHCRLMANYETFVQYQFARGERAALVAARGDRALLEAGLARIEQAPAAYLGLATANLYCLWSLWAATDAEKAALRNYLVADRPIPFDAETAQSLATSPSAALIVLVRPVMWGIAVLFAAAGAAVLWSAVRGRLPDPWLTLAGLCGLLVHGSLIATAFTGVAIPRYTIGLWPFFCLGVWALCMWGAARWLSRRKVVQSGPTR